MIMLTQTGIYSLATRFSLKINHHQARYTVIEKQVQNLFYNTSSFFGGSPQVFFLVDVDVSISR